VWNYLNYAQYFNFWFTLGSLFFIDQLPFLTLIPLAITIPLVITALHQCHIHNADKIALYLNINMLVCSVIITYTVFSKTNIFSMDLFIQPPILYMIVVETIISTLLLIAKTFNDAIANEKQHVQTNIDHIQYQAQTDIISRLSNEFRTPISGILGMAELLKSSSLTAEQHGKVDSIKNAANTLLNTVSDMHYHAQLKQNTATVRQSPFELRLLLETCVLNFQSQAENRSIELILNIQPDVPSIVVGDELRLRQILIQLLDNAIKNTRQGEIIIKVSTLASDANYLEFSIRDTGSGINEQHLRQLDTPRSTDTLASGHGLPSAQELLTQLKSSLLINSSEGEGSELFFALSLPSSDSTHANSKTPGTLLKYKRLLIVDDNLTYCKVLKQQTTSWGMNVTEAHSGNEAIAMYRAKRNLGETFDAIIIDYDMPVVSGIEVAEKISMEAIEPPVMIMLSGLIQSPPEHIAKQAGIDAILNKPASENLLKLTLANQFHIRQRTTAALQLSALKTQRVLLAEDNDVMRSVISKMMDTLPVEYMMVSDGKLAVEAAKKERFDIILMDCEMPFMNGFDATLAIHQWQREKHQPLTPVIALTAYTLGEHKTRSIAAGMVDYLEKPINMIELEAVLQRYAPDEKQHA
jgi:CheY-like chemotaxis protein